MKFFIDMVNLDEIKEVYLLGLLVGVIINFSLVVKENIMFEDCFCEIIEFVEGFVSVEVIVFDVEGMICEGKEFVVIVLNIIIKVLMISDGLKVVKEFISLGIKINVMFIFLVN